MFYKPSRERQWDSWIFKHEETYFMYYINVSEGGLRWDGISLATSRDLVHWQEYGRVLDKDADAVWLGTGMVQRVGDRFIMNYSLEKPAHYQRIYFAESVDLYHWKKIEGVRSAPDDVIYRAEPGESCDVMPRWDSLGVFDPLSGDPPPYYAFCSANARGTATAGKSGVLGLATSMDGLNWTCLPPAFDDPEVFPTCEVPEYFCLNGRHYALFCTSSYLGFRFDERADWAVGGTYYLVADEKTGPYRLPEGDPMLQGTRDHYMVCMNYVGRTFDDDGQRLYYHIWGEPTSDAWMGAVKRSAEVRPGTLELRYYEGNERLKGRVLLSEVRTEEWAEIFRAGVQPAVFWDLTDGEIAFGNNGSAMCLAHRGLEGVPETEAYTALEDGRVLETEIRFAGRCAGLWFGTKKGERACVALNGERQRAEFGYVQNGWGGNVLLRKEHYKDAEVRGGGRLRLLARRMFLEAYLDDRYLGGWRLTEDELDPNRFGVYSEDSEGSFGGLTVWEMK